MTRLIARKKPVWEEASFRSTIDKIFSSSRPGDLEELAKSAVTACVDMEKASHGEVDRLLVCASASVRIAVASARHVCRFCWLPACICESIGRVCDRDDSFEFSVLCHPQEFLRSTSSAKIAVQALDAQFLLFGWDDSRLAALLEKPVYVLFPHAPEGHETVSVSSMMADEGRKKHVLVPDGSWEMCSAMVKDLAARNPETLHFVALSDVSNEFSPLIEGLEKP